MAGDLNHGTVGGGPLVFDGSLRRRHGVINRLFFVLARYEPFHVAPTTH